MCKRIWRCFVVFSLIACYLVIFLFKDRILTWWIAVVAIGLWLLNDVEDYLTETFRKTHNKEE